MTAVALVVVGVVVVVVRSGFLQPQLIRCHPYAFFPTDAGASASSSQVESPCELGEVGVFGRGDGRYELCAY